jgi:hypothetical protein
MIGLFALLMCITNGCSRWVELTNATESSPGQVSSSITQQDQVPLLLDRVQIIRNGSPQDPSIEAGQRVLGTFSDIGLFSRSVSAENAESSLNGKVIHARLQVDETIEPHPGEAAWKGILIGASMFLLAAVVPLEYEYAAHMTLELDRWDGQNKRYESQSAGKVTYQLFGATPVMVDELKGQVTEECLRTLMQRVVQDTPFYAASSAPLPDNPIRSVSVKARRLQPSNIPVVPIATSPGK